MIVEEESDPEKGPADIPGFQGQQNGRRTVILAEFEIDVEWVI